jgi:hypothetical protein
MAGEAKPAVVSSSDAFVRLAEAYPYDDQPPRLIAAINDAPTDVPEGEVKWGVDRTFIPEKVGDPAVELKHPTELHFDPSKLGKPDAIVKDVTKRAEAIKQILEWVAGRVGQPLGMAWLTQLQSIAQWTLGMSMADAVRATNLDAKAKGQDEAWAQVVTELLFGTDYAGPGDTYAMGAQVDKSNITPAGEGWDQFIYRRIERSFAKQDLWAVPRTGKGGNRVYGAYWLTSWKDILPPKDPAPEPLGTAVHDPPQDMLERHFKAAVNADPAFSVVAACQHVATYLSLMRGYPLDWMGTTTYRAVGLSCSDAMREMPIFGGDAKALGGAKMAVSAPTGGKWFAPHVPVKAGEAAPTGNVIDIGDPKSWVAKTSPATIFVYDPNHGVTGVPLSRFEKTYINREARAEFMRTRTSPGANDPSWDRLVREHLAELDKLNTKISSLEAGPASGATEAAKKKSADELKRAKDRRDFLKSRDPKVGQAFDYRYKVPDVKKRWSERIASLEVTIKAEKKSATPTRLKRLEDDKAKLSKELAEVDEVVKDRTRTNVPEAAFDQLPGSHIQGILRVHASGEKVQVFDTGIGAHLGLLKKTKSEAVVPEAGGGLTADGYRHPLVASFDRSATSHEASGAQIGSGVGNSFGGMGVPGPSPVDLGAQTEWLRGARPVGLVRFAITIGPKGKNLTKNDVLYVSPLRPMYGPAASENFPISRLLWSLRNTPGFSDFRPWWLVYAPKGMLARAMWAEDGRSMSLGDFVRTHGPSNDWRMIRFFQSAEPFSWPPKADTPAGQKERVDARRRAFLGNMTGKRQFSLVLALSNWGTHPDNAGEAQVVNRWKYQEGSTQPVMEGPQGIASLKSLADGLPWNESWPSPLPPEIDAIVPAFFRAPAANTEADWTTKLKTIDASGNDTGSVPASTGGDAGGDEDGGYE